MVGLIVLLSCLSAAGLVLTAPTTLAGPGSFDVGPDDDDDDAANSTLLSPGCNYKQRYITGGQVNYFPTENGFSVDWNTQQDFVVGVGWQPGSRNAITYSGNFVVRSGVGSLGIYGWSVTPLVEYYVHEYLQGLGTDGWKNMGTLQSDGSIYTIYKSTQYNQHSIRGTATFDQFHSVRQSPRTNGTVNMANHIDAWANKGMRLGQLNYQVVAVESWYGSGSAKVTVSC